MRRLKVALFFGAIALLSKQAQAQTFSAGLPAGWNCTGNCGTLGADGVVTLSPTDAARYGYVTTAGGTNQGGLPAFGGGNGSVLRSGSMGLGSGDLLNFYFQFVSSDFAPFYDYAWARLLDAASFSQVAVLFSAQVQGEGGSMTPMPGLAVDATLDPSETFQTNNGSTWSAVPDGADFYGAHTGWVNSTYSIATAGNYVLEFGVSNFPDDIGDAGLAFDGQVVSAVPEPATMTLLATGLAGIAGAARRRRNKQNA